MFREKWVIERNIKCRNKSGHTDTDCLPEVVWWGVFGNYRD